MGVSSITGGQVEGLKEIELKTLEELVLFNREFFRREPTHLTYLTLDLMESSRLQKRLEKKGWDYDHLLDLLRSKWDQVIDHYHGIYVKDVGDLAAVAFGLKEESKERPENLSVMCAMDLHKVTENATFEYIVEGISKKTGINSDQVVAYLTTRRTQWNTTDQLLDWVVVNKEYKKAERLLKSVTGTNKFQIKIGIATGTATPKQKLTKRELTRDIDGPSVTLSYRIYGFGKGGETIVTADVLDKVKDSVYYLSKGEKRNKDFNGEVYNITAVKRYSQEDLAGLAPVDSNLHAELELFRAQTKNALRFIRYFQSGMVENPETHVMEEYDPQNLVLDSKRFERRDKYYADTSLFICTLSYAIAQTMLRQGTMAQDDYTSISENLGITALLADLGVWQSNEKVSGSFKGSPRKQPEDRIEVLKIKKASVAAMEANSCPPLERRHIGYNLKYQHARYDGTGRTAMLYKKSRDIWEREPVGDGIPPIIRILKVARAYVEALSDRTNKLRPYFAQRIEPYQFAETGLQQIRAEEGKRYDPKVVRALEYLLQPATKEMELMPQQTIKI